MNKNPHLRVVACCGVHDEMQGTPFHSLPYCALNVVCSHGNKYLSDALDRGEKIGVLKHEVAEEMRNIIRSVRAALLKRIDGTAVLKREIRLAGSGTDIAENAKRKVERSLGDDRTSWKEMHAAQQLITAGPIIEIAEQLAALGLIAFSPTVVHINTEKMIQANDISCAGGNKT